MRTGHPILTYDDIEPLQEIIRLLRKGRRKERPKPRMRGSHPHWQRRPHRKDHPQPYEHHGGARTADRQSHPNRCRGRTGQCQVVNHRFLDRLNREKPTTMRKLEDIWYRRQRFQLGKPKCPLQFKPVPYAEPPCHLHKAEPLNSAFSILQTQRTESAMDCMPVR